MKKYIKVFLMLIAICLLSCSCSIKLGDYEITLNPDQEIDSPVEDNKDSENENNKTDEDNTDNNNSDNSGGNTDNNSGGNTDNNNGSGNDSNNEGEGNNNDGNQTQSWVEEVRYSLTDCGDESITIRVENQGNFGTCYAVSATTMVETFFLKTEGLDIQLSPIHFAIVSAIDYQRCGESEALTAGGNIYTFMDYAMNTGLVLDEEIPYSNYYLSRQPSSVINECKTKIYSENGIPSIVYVNEIEKLNTVEEVKEHLVNYGACVTSIYFLDSGNYEDVYEYTGEQAENHQVTIIGWDDEKQAFLCLNSYGTTFGDNGYFYISYNDKYVLKTVYGVVRGSINKTMMDNFLTDFEQDILKYPLVREHLNLVTILKNEQECSISKVYLPIIKEDSIINKTIDVYVLPYNSYELSSTFSLTNYVPTVSVLAEDKFVSLTKSIKDSSYYVGNLNFVEINLNSPVKVSTEYYIVAFKLQGVTSYNMYGTKDQESANAYFSSTSNNFTQKTASDRYLNTYIITPIIRVEYSLPYEIEQDIDNDKLILNFNWTIDSNELIINLINNNTIYNIDYSVSSNKVEIDLNKAKYGLNYIQIVYSGSEVNYMYRKSLVEGLSISKALFKNTQMNISIDKNDIEYGLEGIKLAVENVESEDASFRWFKLIEQEKQYLDGETTSILMLTKVSDSGLYGCDVKINEETITLFLEDEVKINKKQIEVPKGRTEVYTGEKIDFFEESDLSSSIFKILDSSEISETVVGSYNITVYLLDDDNYEWVNNGEQLKGKNYSFSWEIEKANPIFENQFEKENLTATYLDKLEKFKQLINNFNENDENGSYEFNDSYETFVGSYGVNIFKVTYTPIDTENFNKIEFDVQISVEKLKVKLPKLSSFDYNAKEREVEIDYLDEYFTFIETTSGTTLKATNAGSYAVVFRLNDDNVMWENGNSESVSLFWEIRKIDYDFSKSYWSNKELTYNGEMQMVTLNNLPKGILESEDVKVKYYIGNYKTKVGDYSTTAVIKYNTTNYNDFDKSILTTTWSIKKSEQQLNIGKSEFIYDGNIHELTVSLICGDGKLTISNNSFTEVGEYLVTINVSETENFLEKTIEVPFTILKNNNIVSFNNSSIILISQNEIDNNASVERVECEEYVKPTILDEYKNYAICDVFSLCYSNINNNVYTYRLKVNKNVDNCKLISISEYLEVEEIEYSIEGNYIVFDAEKPLNLALIREEKEINSNLSIIKIVIPSVIGVGLVISAGIFIYIRKKKLSWK